MQMWRRSATQASRHYSADVLGGGRCVRRSHVLDSNGEESIARPPPRMTAAGQDSIDRWRCCDDRRPPVRQSDQSGERGDGFSNSLGVLGGKKARNCCRAEPRRCIRTHCAWRPLVDGCVL